ncbi:uncharacterized protein LOC115147452 isoform X3 [Salmo trutta]|uniref:uncharacterized protein LOC115147452 isoform X3 n=1 Tax=Salmo trutta TaxID=8032 RepID=UPI00113210BD|nr:uncharacterized protein LOC115147452 isoform X3 [Salmo trutta]
MAKPPPLVPHHRNIYMGKPEESEPQRRWNYGPSPSDPSGPGVGEGRKPGTAQKPPPVTQNKWSVGSDPPQEGGCDPQDGASVSEFIKKFEAKEDQNKQLVVRRPLGPPAVIDREDSNPPLYEKVLVTRETRTFGLPAVVDRKQSSDYIYEEVFVTQETRTKPGTAQKPPPVTQNKWSVGSDPPQEGGCDPQDGASVSEFIKKFEAKEDQNKQLVVRRPLGPPAVIDREDSNPPLYEKVLVTRETRTVAVHQQICTTYVHCVRPPPPLPLKQSLPLKGRIKTLSKSSISEEDQEDNIKDADRLMEWWEKVKSEPWKDLSNDPKLAKKGEAKLFKKKAQRFQNALQLYNLSMGRP